MQRTGEIILVYIILFFTSEIYRCSILIGIFHTIVANYRITVATSARKRINKRQEILLSDCHLEAKNLPYT